jgi:cyclopropane-fatty-acyl-phospholipid synthase
MTSATTAIRAADRGAQITLSVLEDLFGSYHPRDFAVRLWDGTTWGPAPGQPARFTLVLQHPGALRRMFWPPNDISFGEAYIYDDFDIEGDIHALFPVLDYLVELPRGLATKLRFAWNLLSLPAGGRPRPTSRAARLRGALHSKERDKQAVSYHYDAPKEFYAVWLDPDMAYSCAYYTSPDNTLEEAQRQKNDIVCRKLRLQPDERLLDIGCGWGGLVIHAARHYGVQALGFTLNEQHAAEANERIRQAGLADRCRVEVRDYRETGDLGLFDKLASVEMLGHVGEALLPEYFAQTSRLLRPGGTFFIHGIHRSASIRVQRKVSFSNRYIFPDGDAVPISTVLRDAERAGFEVRDVECLREHYALTTRQWLERLEARRNEALQTADEVGYRLYRLFLAGWTYLYQKKTQLNLYHTLLAKPDRGDSKLPLTRADWYA